MNIYTHIVTYEQFCFNYGFDPLDPESKTDYDRYVEGMNHAIEDFLCEPCSDTLH